MSSVGDVVPLSLPIIQHIQDRLNKVTDDTSCLSKEMQRAADEREAPTSRERYETLFAHVKSIETVVQTLKLNFVSLSALQRKPSDAERKTLDAADAYSGEVKMLAQSLSCTKQELADALRKLAYAESERAKHESSLSAAAAATAALESRLDGVLGDQRASCQRIAELQSELLAEKKLRELLERSHATAVEQIRELERAGQRDPLHNEEKTPDTEEILQVKCCLASVQEDVCTWKEAQKQNNLLQAAMYQAMGQKDAEIQQLQNEKQFVINQMTDIHQKYQQLNEQLDHMHSMFEELQREKSQRLKEAEAAAAVRLELERDAESLQQQLATMATEQHRLEEDKDAELAEATKQLVTVGQALSKLEADKSSCLQLVDSLKALIVDQQNESKVVKEKYEKELKALREESAAIACERDNLLQSRQSLLDEVNAAAELMSGEKERTDLELESQCALIAALRQQAAEGEALRAGLEARVSVLQQQEVAHSQFEQTIAELLEQKSKLAYENGQLLALRERVQFLEQENARLQRLAESSGTGEAEAQREVARLKAQCAAAEGEVKKSKSECEWSRTEIERLQSECQRLGAELKAAADRALAEKPPEEDEATQDAALLSQRVEELEQVLKSQTSVHQRTLDILKTDSAKATVSLEGLMELHVQLQQEFEKVQKLLGKRDGQLANMRLSSKEVQRKMAALEKELEGAKKSLCGKEAAEADKMKSLQRSLRQCRLDNCSLVQALKECYSSSKRADVRVRQLEADLASRSETVARLQADRLREREELAMFHKEREELAAFHREHEAAAREEAEAVAERERERIYAKFEEDARELQHEMEALLEQTAELQLCNDSLEARVRLSESAAAEARARQAAITAQLEASEVRRKQLEHAVEQFKGTNTKLAEMERLKDQYMQKSAEQEYQINNFASQVKSLQAELKEVTEGLQCKHDRELARARRQAAQDELRRAEGLSKRCSEYSRRVQQLELALAETRQQERGRPNASHNIEDTPVSARNDCAHHGDTGSGDWLQLGSRSSTSRASPAHETERTSAEESQMSLTAAKAKHFVQVSQAALSRLAEAADLSSTAEAASDFGPAGAGSSTCRSRSSSGQKWTPARSLVAEKDHPATPNSLTNESSSRQLEALIEEMERRHLISY